MTSRQSVLIVDDDRANVIALTLILEREYMIYTAENGRDAVESALKHAPDAILMDVVMPEMSGFQALSQLKEDVRTRNIPVIIITVLESDENRERGLALGAADYITKPFKAEAVLAVVRNYIG